MPAVTEGRLRIGTIVNPEDARPYREVPQAER